MTYRLEFYNTTNNPIEIEEMRNPTKSNEQGLVFEEESLSEENTERNKNSKDSKDTSTTLDSEMAEDSLDEKIIAIGEG